jgi:hypothetical protein
MPMPMDSPSLTATLMPNLKLTVISNSTVISMNSDSKTPILTVTAILT